MKDSAPPLKSPLSWRQGRGVDDIFPDISKGNSGAGGFAAALWLAAALAAASYLLNSPAAHIPTDGTLSALVWPAPAMGVALLWRRPPREWPLLLTAIGAAVFLVGQLDWLPWTVDLLFAVLGPLEVGLGAWLARRWVNAEARLDSMATLLRFVLLLPATLAGVHALLFAGVLWWSMDIAWLPQAGRIYAAQALAFLTVLPALLPAGGDALVTAPTTVAPVRTRKTLLAWATVAASLLLALAPQVPDEATRALLAIALGIAALNQPPVSVARLNVVIALALVAMTLSGRGPYVEPGHIDVWALQLDLAGLSLLSLGLAVALNERRRLAQRLEQTRRMEALGFLAGGIAHDFNNLLGTIGACAELAADQWDAEPLQSPQADTPAPASATAVPPLQLLEREVQRGRDMTQQLLSDVITATRALLPAHVELERIGALPDDLRVQANRAQLQRALHNLVRNAVQAARGRVSVAAGTTASLADASAGLHTWIGAPVTARATTAAQLWIEVRDDGPGIAPEHWTHLFDPFYSTRHASGGSGLGLAIVAGVASSHEGGIGMKTAAGQGTCFRLAIPLVEPSP